jgi:hypothetical protein
MSEQKKHPYIGTEAVIPAVELAAAAGHRIKPMTVGLDLHEPLAGEAQVVGAHRHVRYMHDVTVGQVRYIIDIRSMYTFDAYNEDEF